MAILAKKAERELVPQGTHIATCYEMIEIGTVEETIQGVKKMLKKCSIGWELPNELNQYGEPFTISQEYTLSMGDKANLRKMLESWRGKAFRPEEADEFDITVLIGVPCLINVIQKTSAKGNSYSSIASVTPLMKGTVRPAQINESNLLMYDQWDDAVFEKLPKFMREKIEGSDEYKAMYAMKTAQPDSSGNFTPDNDDSLPF